MGDFDLILDAAAIGGADALATGQEERPGTRGSPEQERREPEEGGSQKRWRGRRGGSGRRSTGGVEQGT